MGRAFGLSSLIGIKRKLMIQGIPCGFRDRTEYVISLYLKNHEETHAFTLTGLLVEQRWLISRQRRCVPLGATNEKAFDHV